MGDAPAPAHYQQNTKSREAYENLQVPFTRRPPSSTSRRYRPQSAGSSRRNHGQGDCINGRRLVIPTAGVTYPTHANTKIGRGKRASFDHRVGPPVIPPPAFSRRKVNGGGTAARKNGGDRVERLGRARTRVRPGSANARVYEKPGAGHGVTCERLGNGSSIAPKHTLATQTLTDTKTTPQAALQPRPKSATIRRTDPSSPYTTRGLENKDSARLAEYNVAPDTGGVKNSNSTTSRPTGSSEEVCESAARVELRPRPSSAVARVETTSHHQGKQVAPKTVKSATSPTAQVSAVTSTKDKTEAAAIAPNACGTGSRGRDSRIDGGNVRKTRVAPRPTSAATRNHIFNETPGQRSHRDSMERVMARIFRQRRIWIGKGGVLSREGVVRWDREMRNVLNFMAGADKSNPRYRRPHSVRPSCSSSKTGPTMAAISAATAAATLSPREPQIRGPVTPAKSSAAKAAKAAAETEGAGNDAVPGEEQYAGTTSSRRGAYAHLFRMKRPGSHRRVGVDHLQTLKKDHNRLSSDGRKGATPPGSNDTTPVVAMIGGRSGVSSDEGVSATSIFGRSKPGKSGGELHPVETQATVSTANTGSLTPLGESSSAEGRTAGDAITRAPPPLEPLTEASAECCSPQERQYLRRLMLDLQGSARSSLDFYRLGKVVGEGSFAKVRVAWHKLTGQRVAVKTYEKAKIKNENQWKRIYQEVKLMERLNHPRVVRLFETAESSKRIHLVMEHADGGNLCAYIKRRKRLNEGEARRILIQLLEGVEYMHSLNIVHRDIKLENVLLEGSGEVNAKLVDFGFSANVNNHRLLHVFCGTPSYMAPEIIKRQEYEGKPVDIWSLGVVLYAMLCGCFPFSGPSYPELYKNISKGVFRVPESLPMSPATLIRGMLVTEPTQRLTLRKVMAHPWLVSLRAARTVWSRTPYRPASAGADRWSRSYSNGLGGGFPGARRESFHISSEPIRDICEESLRRMEAFGVDGGEIYRQVLARRHSCVTTTFYLLKHHLNTRSKQEERLGIDRSDGRDGHVSEDGLKRCSTGGGNGCGLGTSNT